MKKCVLCEEGIDEAFGKLKGTMLRSLNVQGTRDLIHVCSGCQKLDGWYDDAMVKGV